MTLLIAGYGDLGQTLAQQSQVHPRWRNTPVLALSRRKPANLAGSHVIWLGADLTDPQSLDVLANHAPTISDVVYCAAPSEPGELAYQSTYLIGLQNLVQALKKWAPTQHPALLFVSSTGVYDSQAEGLINEQSPTEPRRYNGQILLQAERWLQAQWRDALILRLSGIYGPNRQRLLQSISQAKATMPASNDYWANRIHVHDAGAAIVHLLSGHHQGIFNGTDCHPVPLRELYTKLAELLGAPMPQSADPSPMMGKKRLSNQKLLDTGFVFRWPDCIEGYRHIIAHDLV
jgi:nucleoside-diphosphate-sugar epimerase